MDEMTKLSVGPEEIGRNVTLEHFFFVGTLVDLYDNKNRLIVSKLERVEGYKMACKLADARNQSIFAIPHDPDGGTRIQLEIKPYADPVELDFQITPKKEAVDLSSCFSWIARGKEYVYCVFKRGLHWRIKMESATRDVSIDMGYSFNDAKHACGAIERTGEINVGDDRHVHVYDKHKTEIQSSNEEINHYRAHRDLLRAALVALSMDCDVDVLKDSDGIVYGYLITKQGEFGLRFIVCATPYPPSGYKPDLVASPSPIRRELWWRRAFTLLFHGRRPVPGGGSEF